MYVPLWIKSWFSFLEGASAPETLVERAAALGLPALALTDQHGLYGTVKAHQRAKALGIKLLIGAEVHVSTQDALSAWLAPESQPLRALVFAPSAAAYAELCVLLTQAQARAAKGQALSTPEALCQLEHALVVVLDAPLLPLLEALRGRLWAMIRYHHAEGDAAQARLLASAARNTRTPLLAGNEVLYAHRRDKALQDIMRCIKQRTALDHAGAHLTPNAEHALLSPLEARRRFDHIPGALRATLAFGERFDFSLDQLVYRYPHEGGETAASALACLRDRAFEGARRRFGGFVPDHVAKQLEHELSLIGDLDYSGYFLTMHDIVRFCESQGILCQGRGSAANSVVCYALGVTAVDPMHLDLFFERFLSRERAEPPDIDLDIEHQRREEVIQWVYKRYGSRRAAMVANLIRYRPKSTLRDLGSALALPPRLVDQAAKQLSHFDPWPDNPSELFPRSHPQGRVRWLMRLGPRLLGAPRHLSIHPGGFILGRDPVDQLVPVEPASMPGRRVIQWDKYDVESQGLFKVDLLGLGALTATRHAFDLLRRHKAIDLALHTVPQEDPVTYAMISRGDTTGVFQIESRAQMSMLPRLRPRTYYDLVVQVAIVRPGPIQGDMVHPYVRRRNGEEAVSFPHPLLKDVLAKTLGVPIFQEQVMKLAVRVAGYSPGEADQLRRDMAAFQKQGRIEQHRERIIDGMVARGVPTEFAERVFSQIRGFGEYGFPESHAASFARIAYVTAWLRAHHPEAYLCALLNAQPMGFYAPSTLIEDAKRHEVIVRPIDINHSHWDCDLEPVGNRLAVRMGLAYVQGLSAVHRATLAPWLKHPPGKRVEHLERFVLDTRLDIAALKALAHAGAFDSLGVARRDALWQVHQCRGLVPGHSDKQALLESAPQEVDPAFPALSDVGAVAWDYERTAHSTRGHPMQSLRPRLPGRIACAAKLNSSRNGARVSYVGCVICRQRPHTAKGVTFLTLEDETGWVNAVIWRHVFERFPALTKRAGVLGIEGRLQVASGVTHLVADTLWLPDLPLQAVRARDFH